MSDNKPVELNLELGFVVGGNATSSRRSNHDDDNASNQGHDYDNDDGTMMMAEGAASKSIGRSHHNYDPYYDLEEDYYSEDGANVKEEEGNETDIDDNIDDFEEQDEDEDEEVSHHGYNPINEEGEEECDNNEASKEQSNLNNLKKQSSTKATFETRQSKREISSLVQLATLKIASNLEKYPPSSLGVLSEYHWDAIVQARVQFQIQKRKESWKAPKSKNFIGYDGDCKLMDNKNGNSNNCNSSIKCSNERKMLPSLSAKFLLPIESHPNNIHISQSKMADNLLWREIVNYHYGGMNRPLSLEVPCNVVKERLCNWGSELGRIMLVPMSLEEFEKERMQQQQMQQQKKYEQQEKQEKKEENITGESMDSSSNKRKRNDSVVDELFGMEDGEADDPPPDGNHDEIIDTSKLKEDYQQYLEKESRERTGTLRSILHSLQSSPMGVTLLSETEIGKCASKAVKSMKKLLKPFSKSTSGKQRQQFDDNEEREMEEAFLGYPHFWKSFLWEGVEVAPQSLKHPSAAPGRNQLQQQETSSYQMLQDILQDWKDMACKDGNKDEPPTKKRKMEKAMVVATCGKSKKLSEQQHAIDMKLLHASPTWRALYTSLRERESLMRKSHGDKVRAIKESLEKGRRTVGKVTLKRAMGRVRGHVSGGGSSGSGGGSGSGEKMATSSGSKSSFASKQRTERREAILNRSRGNRTMQQQQQQQSSFSLFGGSGSKGGGGGSKLSQLRHESKVASAWSKGTLSSQTSTASKFGNAVANSSFGASVARASNGKTGRAKQSQALVQLRGGKQMKLPPKSMGGMGKTVGVGGVFSSLQEKKEKKEQQQQLLKQRARMQQQSPQKQRMMKPPPRGDTTRRSNPPSQRGRSMMKQIKQPSQMHRGARRDDGSAGNRKRW